MNYVRKPHQSHGSRFVPQEKRKAIQRATDERRERQGKRVIHLHESFGDCLPPTEAIKEDIRRYWKEMGARPTILRVPFRVRSKWLCVYMDDLPPSDDGLHIVDLRIIPGEDLSLDRD